MKHFTGILLAAGIILGACARKTETPPETPLNLAYEMKTFKLQSEHCASDTAACASFTVTYPVFAGLDTAVQLAIRQQIDTVLAGEGPAQTWEDAARAFIADYTEFTKEMPGEASGWYFNNDIQVSVASDSLISLAVYQDTYGGGAHPNAMVAFINIHPRTGERMTLEDFFVPGFGETLTQKGEKAFRRARSLGDADSFVENGFEFEDDRFALNSNYGFTPQGILFYYNSYEVAPYAAGPTEVLIPYAEMKDWLKK